MCVYSITQSLNSAANPSLHSWEVLQPNIGPMQTVTVTKAKRGHEIENNNGSLEGLRGREERMEM